MQHFLSKVANYILEKYHNELTDVCIVTPNRRSGLFFRKHLGKIAKGPLWAPEIIGFEDFLSRFTGLQKCDHVSLCIEFYKVYKKVKTENPDGFEDFLKWAPALLRDFNDIDSAVVDSNDFFSYLNDVKYLETWDPEGAGLTDFQKDYLEFFRDMKVYYDNLGSHLLKNNIAYQGLMIRYALNNLQKLCENLKWRKIIFVGFYAMPTGEELIIKRMVKDGYADVLWDADKYYFDNHDHEAGMFLRKYKENWRLNEFNFIGEYFKSSAKKIHITGVPQNVNQAKVVGNILDDFSNEGISEETAVVLANENLLMPVLNSLPEKVDSFNVTMGFPLNKTGIYGFFEAFSRMHLSAEKFGLDDGLPRFYHKDIIRVFSHNACSLLIKSSETYTHGEFVDKLSQSNRILYSKNTISEIKNGEQLLSNFYPDLLAHWKSPAEALKSLIEICSYMEAGLHTNDTNEKQTCKTDIDIVDEQAITQIKSVLRRLESIIEEEGLITNNKTLISVFQALISESKLAFTGEPLTGIQIIGMLETRNLDFKNIIMLSVNENILPAPSKKVSFIHFDIRLKYGMHKYSDSDALYAYHFYRLLQRAENIYLVYNTQAESVGGSEKSRFITQIEHELTDYNPNITINHNIITIPVPVKPDKHEISVEKTEQVFNRLYSLNESGFSPSALSIYIKCPLQFYFSYVANIKEADEVEETIEANTLGNVVHEVLKELYSKYTGKSLMPDDISKMIPQVDNITSAKFKKIYKGGNISTGKNLLIRRMAERFAVNFLKQELSALQTNKVNNLEIVALEKKFSRNITVSENGKNYAFNMKGLIDRVDIYNGDLRIIDYKTGAVDKKELEIDEVDKAVSDPAYSKVFQLLTYAFLFDEGNLNSESMLAGIFSLRKYSAGLLKLKLPDGNIIDKITLSYFGKCLEELMLDIFNKDKTFSQTIEEENCRFCPFLVVCNRK